MSSVRQGGTLFEIVPALGKITAHGAGTARLMAVDSAHTGITLTEGLNRLGRDPSQSDHVISSSHVSRTHCTVLLREGTFQVSDLMSHNGTFINKERITTGEMKPGATLGLSRRVNFILVMDSDMERPAHKMVDLGGGPPAVAPAPAGPLVAVASVAVDPLEGLSALEEPEDDGSGQGSEDPNLAAQLRQLEVEHNELSILYQIALHCLMADSVSEAEKLLSNVVQRVLPLDGGFILYQTGELWRAAICPDSKTQPSNELIKGFFQQARQRYAPEVITAPVELGALGLQGGSAMIIPLLCDDTLRGVIGAFTSQPEAYTPQLLNTMVQLGEVTTAALRDR